MKELGAQGVVLAGDPGEGDVLAEAASGDACGSGRLCLS